MQLFSKLTSKCQATIPKEIREQLNLKAGDRVVFTVENEQVTIQKASPVDAEYLNAIAETLGEWSSPADEEAYDYL